jgi:hypothetical protein
MLRRVPLVRLGFGIGCLFLLALAGCAQQQASDEGEYDQLFQDDPLHFKLNAKSEVFLHNRWVNVFNEQGTLRNHLRKEAERYQQYFENEGTALQSSPESRQAKVIFPTEVVIEPEPKTKAGTVLCIQRLCKEYGFFKFTIKLPEVDPDQMPPVVEGQ